MIRRLIPETKHSKMIADLITVDKDLCIGCGLCASVCPYATIKLEDGHPVAVKVADINQSQCCGCGHCVSICPKAALDNKFAPLSAQKPIDKSIKSFSEQDAAAFLIGRRSIRYFEDKSIPESVLLKLLDVAKYAPTGCNLQGIKFLIIQDKAILLQIKEAAAKFLELQAKISTPPG
ncbi:MAG: putative 4Fe-4S binding domain protein, partial [Streblomastix strix]